MSVRPLEDVWEVRGLPVVGDPSDPGQVTASGPRAVSSSDLRAAADDGGGVVGRVAIIRKQRFVRLEQERRREMRLVESRIEQVAVEEARRMTKLLGYGEDDLVRWKRRIEPQHFNTYSAADFTTLMEDLHAIYRARQEIIADCFSRQMSLEAERTARLRDVFKKYHPLLTRAFHKMPAEVEEQLELEAVALNEMILSNLRQYAELRFNRLTAEVEAKQKLKNLWKVRRDAWRTLNILQAEKRLSEYLRAAAVESHVEASLAELETCMDTVWQHYREHVTGLPDLFLKHVTDESVDEWQDQAYEILNSMSTMVTAHCKSYRRLYLDLENAWYEQLDKVGDDLVHREVTDVEQWESLADHHTATMFGPIRSKVENNVTAAQERWSQVVKAAPGQVDHLYNYIASSCEVFSLHLAERVRYAKKLEIQLQAVDSQQAAKEAQLEQKIQKSVASMLEESKVAKVHQIQQALAKQMAAFLPTYEQFQERRLQLLLAHSERLESETLLVQANVAEKLEATITSPEPPPEEPPEDCHRLMGACRRVLLLPSELTELQSLSAANIRWFLSWERRTLEQDLGDFLLDKLKKLKALFYSKADGLTERTAEIETTIHDRRSSEIQLHQQRVDSHCRSVHDELKWIQSQQSGEMEAIRARLDEERAWLAAHELRSRSASRSYVLQMMLTQIGEREARFVDSLVERSASFRQRVETFSADLTASTRAFLHQLVPQPPPEVPPPSRQPSLAGAGRTDSVRVAVLRQEARKASGAPAAQRRASSTRSSRLAVSKRVSRRRSKEEDIAEGDEAGATQPQVGNFSNEEIVKYKATLKKLLMTIDQTGKIQCKTLEHRMELFCAALDEAIKKAEGSIRAQIGDVQFSETMQRYYVSINTLIKSEMHLNQEETQGTKQLIRNLADRLDEYEKKWEVNMRRESQLSVYFQPTAAVQWQEHSVELSGCIMEGTSALGRVEELFEQICARHRYLYYAQLDGTVDFRGDSSEESPQSGASSEAGAEGPNGEPAAAQSGTELPPAGGSAAAVVQAPADGGATVRMDETIARQALQSRKGRRGATKKVRGVSGRRAGSTRSSASRGASGGSEPAGGPADGADSPPASPTGSGTAATAESGYTADVSASAETATVTTAATSNKTEKRRDKKKAAQGLSKMEEAEVITFLFGNVERPTDSNNFIQKVQWKILNVLQETRETASNFYLQKGSRAVTRPDLVPATYDELLETLFARFQAYYTESAQYQLACFAEFCDDFAEFARQAARIPCLLFRHQSELFCRQTAAVTRRRVQLLSEQERLWADTAADLERRLRPGLGHPNQHCRLFVLVEWAVEQKEAHLSRLRQLDADRAAARDQLQAEFERSAAFVADRCRAALLALTAAAHLSPTGLKTLTRLLTEAVDRPREACQRAWDAESRDCETGWEQVLRAAVTACQRWTANWFSGVEGVQELYRMCEV
ncbi:uncharacterized protein LOC122364367 isoform X1 [Amphibalanus amphitrite]|uniref:uncharacterized protein LOC122364367 isoform X1 n=1 Tax=Amphibalanus amphitrite TaxID=1232801 RepID=UPI001C926B32|nr:uncharacterized protein LOC122364367 isoform X1 [Amphibalanus amphitrite]